MIGISIDFTFSGDKLLEFSISFGIVDSRNFDNVRTFVYRYPCNKG